MTDDVASNNGPIRGAFRIDEAQVRRHMDEVVRESVELTLNGLLHTEVEQLCEAGKYERTDARNNTRAGSYKRKAAHEGGRAEAERVEIAEFAVRDADHRALHASGVER